MGHCFWQVRSSPRSASRNCALSLRCGCSALGFAPLVQGSLAYHRGLVMNLSARSAPLRCWDLEERKRAKTRRFSERVAEQAAQAVLPQHGSETQQKIHSLDGLIEIVIARRMANDDIEKSERENIVGHWCFGRFSLGSVIYQKLLFSPFNNYFQEFFLCGYIKRKKHS
ncbi:unnamed protein product [Amoebophrya sp. A25]|nr:unnamed protein product [Amoebophrya sp. A25]|eukprot:GSA25T00012807001.1